MTAAPALPRMPEEVKSIHFPLAGVDVSCPFSRQPNVPVEGGVYARTTRGAVNVRGLEPSENRLRGGMRPGLSRYLSTRPGNTTFITQNLSVMAGTEYPAAGGGSVQTSQSGRIVTLVVVSQGNVYIADAGDTTWTSTTNGTANTPPLNYSGIVFSALNNQKLWFADGVNYCYYDRVLNTVFPWVPGVYTAADVALFRAANAGGSKGTLPVDSAGNTPRLICTWRGRTVLSGLILDPINWFMSRVGDPTDFDYAPLSVSPTQAIAGNNAPQGQLSDPIMSIIPYSDDVLFMGGQHSIYMFRGDPMAGGQIDLVTNSIGTAWGNPWCRGPDGTVYFFSNRTGIFALVPGQQPQRVSSQIDSLLLDIDTGENAINMTWSDRYQGFHVFVTPLAAPMATTHYFYELRSNAWWPDFFGNNNHNPLCACTFDGNLPGDRVVLIGSWDGYVRALDQNAGTDDLTPILARVLIGPIATDTLDEMMLKDIQPVLAENSGDVDYKIYAGPTAEMALASSPVASGTWTVSTLLGGRNLTGFIRRASHDIYIELSSTNRFAMEQLRIRIASQGKVRQRGR